MMETNAIVARPDEDILEDVQRALWRSDVLRVARPPIAVAVESGQVTLTGVVPSTIMRGEIEMLVTAVPGVVRVEDRLLADSDLAVAVARALAASPRLGPEAFNVRVTSYEGVVTLTGKVSGETLRREAVAAASRVAGVRQVVDRLFTPN